MDDESRKTRHPKSSKSSRKLRSTQTRTNKSGQGFSQVSAQADLASNESPNSMDNDLLNAIIGEMTSDVDDTRGPSSSSILATGSTMSKEPRKASGSTRKPMRREGKSSRYDDRSTSRLSAYDEKRDSSNRRKSMGDQRREQLTQHMKDFYQDCFEFDHNSNMNYIHDNVKHNEKRKQYSETLWYALKMYFNGITPSDENGIDTEQRAIDRQRKRSLDEFYSLFSRCDFEKSSYHERPTIQRHHLCEHYLNHCKTVDRDMQFLFSKWDHILSLFPSYKALEEYDKRFDPRTKEGGIFYGKLVIFQAWYNLHSEINRLISVLGRILSCTQCHTWPQVTHSTVSKVADTASRPPTPSSTSSNEQRDLMPVSSPHGLPCANTPEIKVKRAHTITSMPSMDSLYQQSLTTASQLTDYYYRYVDDQVTHARIELVARIFRSKHGPLSQRLRYTYHQEQGTVPSTFDSVFKNASFLPSNLIPQDYLQDAKPDKLIDEFLMLNKQLQEQKNPDLATKNKKKSTRVHSTQVNHILNRFHQNPTLTSSTFPSVSAPALVLKILADDRSVLKRQTYFLDYIDPTSYPHLPGSTLFPDPCTFLDNSPFYSYSQLTPEENLLIAKMLAIAHRLYDKHVWVDSGRFSDMCDIFHLPSLYPQYVFLVQIPLDLMITWQKYHQDKKMKQTSTTSALLLLIDECKILIHSAAVVRQYVRLMITDTFEKAELKLIEHELAQLDRNIIDTIHEIMTYIESYIEASLRSNLFHNCIILLKDQWKMLKKYATIMNMEEILGEKFLNLYSNTIKCFHQYMNIFHLSTASSESMTIEHMKKRMQRKYQKKLTMDILREAKAIYDDCALTINIYLQKPVCKRFLLILKTARFERIKFVSENRHDHRTDRATKDGSPALKCLLFAPAEYFEDNTTKLQLVRILSSSFRIHTTSNAAQEMNDDQSSQPPPPQTQQQQQPSPTSSQPTSMSAQDPSSPLVYLLCVPVSNEIESEWRGVTHTISENKHLTSIVPLNTDWKTTTIFLLTQQTNHLDKFEQSFKERLSKINVQQSDLYNFEKAKAQVLQKRSCFEKTDRAMNGLAHSILSLSTCITNNVEHFERTILQTSTRAYVHTEERAFAFAMDIIREASFYATQFELDTLAAQAERQILFANAWLNFVRKKKSTTMSKYPTALPMWLLPGIHFLRHICSLHFTNHIDDALFAEFYQYILKTMDYLSSPYDVNSQATANTRSRPFQYSSMAKRTYDRLRKKKVRLSKIEQLERMDRRIDRRRADDGLIGKIKLVNKSSFISRKMEDDLAYLKIRNFHKLNLLARGQFATTYKCSVQRGDKQEILCYKQYKIQHNDAQAISKVLEQLLPLMHIDHENLLKYHGIALENDHILFFMEYCSHGTVAQLLLGTSLSSSSSHVDVRSQSTSLVCSTTDTSLVDKGIIQSTAGFAFFEEYLVQRYLRQLLSALSRLHEKEIIHRDIRNVNIFLTDSSKQSIKLGDVNFVYDFKFMKNQSSVLDMEAVLNIRESIVFYAPETITQNETTMKSDIWSLGCALIHMLTGRIPWSHPTIASNVYYLKIIDWIANGVQPSIPTDLRLSTDCIHFLKQCFQHDPNQRPSSHELLEHPFVKEK